MNLNDMNERLTPLPVKMVYESNPGSGSWAKAAYEQEQVAQLAARDREIERLRALADELAAALEDIVARNEIQNWFNLDHARSALAKWRAKEPK